MRGQRREGRIPSVEPELRSGCQIDVTFYPQILVKSHNPVFPIWNCLEPLQARNVAYCNSMRPPRV